MVKKVDNLNELEECLKIREEVFQKGQNVPKIIEIDDYDIIDNKVVHFLMRDDDLIATCRCIYLDDSIKLQRVAVLKEYRGKNYGKDLIKYVEEFAKEKNIKKIILNSQYQAINFYKKLGYVEVGDEFLEANIVHVKMEKMI